MRNNIVSTHLKRQTRKSTSGKIISTLLIIVMVVTLLLLIKNYICNKNKTTDYVKSEVVNQVKDKVLEQTTLQAEADITQAVLDVKATKAERFVKEVNNEIEFITLQESGNYTIGHSRLDGDEGFWKKTFNESSIEVNFDYNAIFSLKTSDILTYQSNGTVYVEYDINNIKIKAIETSKPTTDSDRDWFGKAYSNQETLSLVEIAKDAIREQLNTEDKLKIQSSNNLNTYLKSIAEKVGVDNLVINNQEIIHSSYNFINNGTVKFNHGNQPLERVDYILIHSTACPNITAQQFYTSLNTYKLKRKASANFFVDDKDVVQAIAPNLQSWHCGCKNPKVNCTNSNSLSVEICQFDDKEEQQKAIDNAVSFVNEVLRKQYPQAKILMHRQVNSSTACPSILTDLDFEKYFK